MTVGLIRREVILFFVAAGAVVLWMVVSVQLMPSDPVTPLRAIASFWASGWAANHALDPYAIYPILPPTFFPGLMPQGANLSAHEINLNPPAMLPLFQVLALFDPYAVLRPWVVANTAIIILTGLHLLRNAPRPVRWWQIILMLLITPVRDTIWLGQIYGLMLLCAAVGWIALKQRYTLVAGLAIGALAAMKPNFLLWPAFLFLIGLRRVAVVSVSLVAVLCLLPALLDGPQIYPQWLHAVRIDQHWLFTTDISMTGVFHRAGAASLGTAVSLLLVVTSAYLVWRRRLGVLRTSSIALCVGMLAAPLAWGDYAIVLVPALMEGLWGRGGIVAGALLMIPVRIPISTMTGSREYQFLGTLVPLFPVCIVLWAACSPEEGRGSASGHTGA